MSEALGNEASNFEPGLDREGQLTTRHTDDAFDARLRERYRAFEAELSAVIGNREIQIPPHPIQPEQGEQ